MSLQDCGPRGVFREKVLVSTVGEEGVLGEGPHLRKCLVLSEPQGPHLPKGSQSPLETAQRGRWQAAGQGRPQVLRAPGSGSRGTLAHTTGPHCRGILVQGSR